MFDTIEDICKEYNTGHYFDDGNGYIGVWDGDTSRVRWFAVRQGQYVVTGTTMGPEGADRRELESKENR